MGVSGSGKTTIGKELCGRLNWRYYEGDDYHPESNVKKMSNGIPLTDDDRRPWLMKLRSLIEESLNKNENIVLACSALKKSYRNILKINEEVRIVYLKGSFELIKERLEQREAHFMKAGMLRSQFDALEEPKDVHTVKIDKSVPEIVDKIIEDLDL